MALYLTLFGTVRSVTPTLSNCTVSSTGILLSLSSLATLSIAQPPVLWPTRMIRGDSVFSASVRGRGGLGNLLRIQSRQDFQATGMKVSAHTSEYPGPRRMFRN